MTLEKHTCSLPVFFFLSLALLALLFRFALCLFALFLSFLSLKFLANLLIVVHLL